VKARVRVIPLMAVGGAGKFNLHTGHGERCTDPADFHRRDGMATGTQARGLLTEVKVTPGFPP